MKKKIGQAKSEDDIEDVETTMEESVGSLPLDKNKEITNKKKLKRS